ncbi:MAG: GAF domain-containing protein [Alphaproteobacteria bacterium]|nr:GAF domain-containing protein [Alphaproteobacteria bacterium]
MSQSTIDARREFLNARERLRAAGGRDEIIECVRQMGRASIGCDGITFVMREGDFCHYVEEDAIAPLWKGRRFPLSSCISGWSMLNASTAVIEDVYADERIPQDAYRPTFVKSLIMTPVIAGKPVAAIGAYWKTQRHFSPFEIRSAQAISDAVGQALTTWLAGRD